MAVLAACGRHRTERELRVVHRGWPLTLSPHLKSEVVTVSVQSNIFESLVALTPEMELRPQLAESWECPDELTWIFRIRNGVRFHNGSELTSEDVVYSLERARCHPSSSLQANFTEVANISAAGKLTIAITTRRPCPSLPSKLTNVFIVPQKALEELGVAKDSLFSANPIGTGPYRFSKWNAGGPLEFKYWDGYWGERPRFRTLDIWGRWRLDSALAMLGQGGADIVTQIEAESAESLKAAAHPGFRIVSRPGLMMRYLGFNCLRRPFHDRRVRKAVALAIDRREIADSAYGGFAVPANQLVPPGVFGYDPELPPLACDPRQARLLLQQAGHPEGITATLVLPDARLGLGRLLQKQLIRSGIDLRLQALGREEFFKAVDTASLFLMGASNLSNEAGDLFEDAIHTKTGGYGTTNRGGYSNTGVDTMIERATRLSDPEERLKLLQRIMATAMDDMPRVPLVIAEDIYAISDRVRWKPRVDLMVLGKEADFAKTGSGIK